ncbi:MAG: thiamine pyrophosphate-binding protein [Candidatus Solibacter sp.]|jgi:acetolactate synthase-1/2/3 large subunit
MPNGAELFVRAGAQLGLDPIFTLVGDHLNEVLAGAARAGMRVVDMRHESGAAHAADAWARIHRRPALSLVTGGPGHTNSLTGIATADLAGSPLIAVSGSLARGMADRQAFQDIDQVGMARPVVKWAAEVPSAGEIPFYLERAYAEANSGRRGAVHLTIPVDVFTGTAADTALGGGARDTAPGCPDVAQATALLRAAKRPVAIAGSGVWWSGAERALREFVERTQIPLYTITMARGTVPDDHPLSMGYADPALNYAVHAVFREADLFLVIGKRIDYRLALGGTRLFPAEAKFIQIDIHPQELGMNRALDAAVCGDARVALDAIPDAGGGRTEWLARVRELRAQWAARLEAETADAAVFFRALREALPEDVLFSWDGGDFAHWGRAILPARQAGGWLRLGPLGTIGSSLPNAIALQLAHPGRRVVAITGDGALGFYLAEMDTAARFGLPIVLIVGNDAGWGLERELQRWGTGGAPTVACELQQARYDLVMKAFGGDGETIERPEEVRPALGRALASRVPYCLNVKIRGARSPFTEWQIAGKKK